jgi:hypothetical protein
LDGTVPLPQFVPRRAMAGTLVTRRFPGIQAIYLESLTVLGVCVCFFFFFESSTETCPRYTLLESGRFVWAIGVKSEVASGHHTTPFVQQGMGAKIETFTAAQQIWWSTGSAFGNQHPVLAPFLVHKRTYFCNTQK